MQDAVSSHPDAAAHYRYRSASQINGSFATLSSPTEIARRMCCEKLPVRCDPCPAKVSGCLSGALSAMLNQYSSGTCVKIRKKIWTFVWIVALKADGYVILSAHESVPCDEIFKPLVSCRADRRFGSPVPVEIVCISPAPHPGWSTAIGHFIRPPILSSPCACVRSVPGRPVPFCTRLAGVGSPNHHRRSAFPGDDRCRYTRRNSR